MDNYTPLSLEAERLLKVANDLNKSFLLFGKPTEAEVKAAIEAAENAIKAAEADLKQRNAGRCILSETPPIDGTVTYEFKASGLPMNSYAQILRTHLEEQDIYISTYPHTHHKRGMFYAAVVQCFSQVYYSYYEWQGDDTYKWETAEAIHHTEFERTKKELSHATYEQALERAFDIAFGLIRDNLNNE